MKALKEKRISLRSLWRRGLVILSLFALVFASCGSSSSDDSSGPQINGIKVLTGPTNGQYYGKKVDLTGVTLEVKTSDGKVTTTTASDIKNFTTLPRVVTGWYFDWDAFQAFTDYKIVYKGHVADLDFAALKVKTYPILRSDTIVEDYDPLTPWKYSGLYSNGLYLTGIENMKKTKYYTDDEHFDFSGLSLEALYVNTALDKLEQKPISFQDVTWNLIPDYTAKKNADGSYPGACYLTVGDPVGVNEGMNGTDPGTLNPTPWGPFGGAFAGGVSLAIPLEAVWTVKDVDGISFVGGEPALGDFFFFDANTRDSWVKRFGDTQIDVTYTGGVANKQFKIKDLAAVDRIYWNENINDNWDRDFGIAPVLFPLNKKVTPKITVYYRGGKKDVEVPVYTALKSVTADFKDPSNTNFEPYGPDRDNDVELGVRGRKGLASLLKVTATYEAFNSPGTQTTIDLDYATAPTYGSGPYWNFVNYDGSTDVYGTLTGELLGDGYWYTNYLVNPGVKDGATKAVTVFHEVYRDDVQNALAAADGIDGDYFSSFAETIKESQAKNAKVNVTWKMPAYNADTGVLTTPIRMK